MNQRRTDHPLDDDPECRAVFAIFWLAVASAWGGIVMLLMQ